LNNFGDEILRDSDAQQALHIYDYQTRGSVAEIIFVSCSIEKSFVPVMGHEIHSGNIEDVTSKEKSKFPQDFFPEVSVMHQFGDKNTKFVVYIV
jgi:hypothetical protein